MLAIRLKPSNSDEGHSVPVFTTSPSTCQYCRKQFDSNNKLEEHLIINCWTTIHARNYPEEWTPDLFDYVRRALDPKNSEPGWSTSEILKELKTMIEINDLLDPVIGARWRTLPLPQVIDPEDLPYDRSPRLKPVGNNTSQSAMPTKMSGREDTTTLIYPSVFEAGLPSCAPQSLFKHEDGQPFIAYRDELEILLFTDGSCSNNGQESPKGGCAVVYKYCDPSNYCPPVEGASLHNGVLFFRLEDVGPTGQSYQPTSNRAELRAVVAALSFPMTHESDLDSWIFEEKTRLVIATDSTYVINGATQWVRLWEVNGWTKSNGESVKNKDLWECLLQRLRLLQNKHCQNISFWHIGRDLNQRADRAAKHAATLPQRKAFGVMLSG